MPTFVFAENQTINQSGNISLDLPNSLDDLPLEASLAKVVDDLPLDSSSVTELSDLESSQTPLPEVQDSSKPSRSKAQIIPSRTSSQSINNNLSINLMEPISGNNYTGFFTFQLLNADSNVNCFILGNWSNSQASDTQNATNLSDGTHNVNVLNLENNTVPGEFYSWNLTCLSVLNSSDNKTSSTESFLMTAPPPQSAVTNITLEKVSKKDTYSDNDTIIFQILVNNSGSTNITEILLSDNFNPSILNLTSTNCNLTYFNQSLGKFQMNLTSCFGVLLPNQSLKIETNYSYIGNVSLPTITTNNVNLSFSDSNGQFSKTSSKSVNIDHKWFADFTALNSLNVNSLNNLLVNFSGHAYKGVLEGLVYVLISQTENRSVYFAENDLFGLNLSDANFMDIGWDGSLLVENQTELLHYNTFSKSGDSQEIVLKGYIDSSEFELHYNYSKLFDDFTFIGGFNISDNGTFSPAIILENDYFEPKAELMNGSEFIFPPRIIKTQNLSFETVNNSFYTLKLKLYESLAGEVIDLPQGYNSVKVSDTSSSSNSSLMIVGLISPLDNQTWDGNGGFQYYLNYSQPADCTLLIINSSWNDSQTNNNVNPGIHSFVYDLMNLDEGSSYNWSVSCKDIPNSLQNSSSTFSFVLDSFGWSGNTNYTPLWSHAHNASFFSSARDLFDFSGAPYVVRGPGCKLEQQFGGLNSYMNATPGENCCSSWGSCPTNVSDDMNALDLGAVFVDQAQGYIAWHLAGPGLHNDSFSYCTGTPNNAAFVVEFDVDDNTSTGCDSNLEGCYPGADYQIWFFPDNGTSLFAYYNGSQASVDGRPAGVGNCSNNPGGACYIENASVNVDFFFNCSPDMVAPSVIDDGLTIVLNKSVLPQPIKLNFETNSFNVTEARANPIDQLTDNGFDPFLFMGPGANAGSDCFLNDGNESACLADPACMWTPLGPGDGLCDPDFNSFSATDACFFYDNTNQTACENSPLGCEWVPNATTPDGVQNLCVLMFAPGSFFGGDCDSDCFNCFTEVQCQNSEANGGSQYGGCEWYNDSFNSEGWCDIEGLRSGCEETVADCLDNTSCETRTAGGFWNSIYSVCQEFPGAEICFNNLDDDGDGYVDCDDVDCEDLEYCGAGVNTLTGMFAGLSPTEAVFQQLSMNLGPVIDLQDDPDNDSNSDFTEITGAGVAVGNKALALGMKIVNLSDLFACGGPVQDRHFMFFMDTDTNSSTGCNFTIDGQVHEGYEYLIKYGDYSVVNESGKTRILYVCYNNNWVVKDGALFGVEAMSGPFMMTSIPLECQSHDPMAPPGQKDPAAAVMIEKSAIGNPVDDIKFGFAVINGSWNDFSNLSAFDSLLDVYYTPGTIGSHPVDCFQDPLSCASQFTVIGGGNFMPFEDCVMPGDEDIDGLENCADPDCVNAPNCVDDPNRYNASNDHTAPGITLNSVDETDKVAFIHWTVDEPSNGTILFYNNDSSCSLINKSVFDEGLPGTFDDFIPWHEVVLDDLSLGYFLNESTTYYYKILNYDLAGNMGQSACLNFTTEAAPQNISVLFNYTPQALSPTDFLGNLSIEIDGSPISLGQASSNPAQTYVNLTFRNPSAPADKNWSITLVGVNLLQALNLDFSSMFLVNNSGLHGVIVGMPNFGWTELSQSLGVSQVILRIPNSASSLYHCNNDGSNCTEITNESGVDRVNFGIGWSEWEVPASIGFSTYSVGGNNYTLYFTNLTSLHEEANLSQNRSYSLNLTNGDNETHMYNISLESSQLGTLNWYIDPSQLSLNSGETGNVNITVNSDFPGVYLFNVTAYINGTNISFNSYDDFSSSYSLDVLSNSSGSSNTSVGVVNLTSCPGDNLNNNTIYLLQNNFDSEALWQGNYSWECINFHQHNENVTIDCQGHSIIGDNSTRAIVMNDHVSNITIQNCIFSNVNGSIYVISSHSDGIFIFNNSLSNYQPYDDGGIVIDGGDGTLDNVQLIGNDIDMGFGNKSGVILTFTNDILIKNNTFRNLLSNSNTSYYYYAGLFLGYSGRPSTNATVVDNNFYQVSVGLRANALLNSTITRNNFLNVSGRDVYLYSDSSGNIFYNNSFSHNLTVWDDGVNNSWNTPLMGNHWLEYNGVDDGFLENESNACRDESPQDGFCDNPYYLAGTAGAADYKAISDYEPSPSVMVTKFLINGDNYSYQVGQVIEYGIEILNDGDFNLSNILLEDNYDSSEMIFDSANCNVSEINESAGNESYVRFNITQCIGGLVASPDDNFTLLINMTPLVGGLLPNQVFVEATNVQNTSETVNDSSIKTVDVEGIISFDISKTLLNTEPLMINQTVQFLINLTNNGTEVVSDDDALIGDMYNADILNFSSASCQVIHSEVNGSEGKLAFNITDCNGGLVYINDTILVYVNFTSKDYGLSNNTAGVVDPLDDSLVYGTDSINFRVNREFTISDLQFNNGSVWKSISNLAYGEKLTKFRINCTNDLNQSAVANASFQFTNLDGSDKDISLTNSTSNLNNTIFELDFIDFNNMDSGRWSLTGNCILSNGSSRSLTENKTLPWGSLVIDLDPSNQHEVQKYSYFNFSARIKCQGGECQDLSVYLDPIRDDSFSTPSRTTSVSRVQINEIENVLNKQDDVRVIVKLKDQGSSQQGVRRSFVSSVSQKGLSVVDNFDSMDNLLVVKVDKNNVQDLLSNPLVENVQLVKRSAHISLNQAVPKIGADKLWSHQINGQNITGLGQTVCVIDTGINYSHPDFRNYSTVPNDKVIGSYCYLEDVNYNLTDGGVGLCPNGKNEDNNSLDDHGHGSHVSGIIASEDSTYRGVAPDARLVEVKALANDGAGWNTDIIKAIDWCVSHKDVYNISVISMSLGDGAYDSVSACEADNTGYTTAINNAVSANITVFVASGNSQDNASFYNKIASPACVGNAISVGAVDINDHMAYFTQAGQLLDLVAPGYPVMSTNYTGGHVAESGTSMATPMVAGLAALINQYSIELNGKSLTPSKMKSVLKVNSVDIDDTANSGYHYDRVNIADASSISGLKGVIPVNDSNSSFYTINNNPYNSSAYPSLASMKAGDEINLSWIVNASGDYDTWDFFVYSLDYNNQEETSSIFNVSIVDMTIPEPVIIKPSNNSLLGDSLQSIKYVVFDGFDSNVTCEIYLDSSLNRTDVVVPDTNQTFNLTLVDGSHNLLVNCSDEYGNYGSAKSIFFVDNSTPSFVSFQTSSSGFVDVPTMITIRANWSDNDLQNVSLFYSNGSLVDVQTTNGGLVNFDWNASVSFAEQNISFYMVGRDRLHSKNTSLSDWIYVRSMPFIKQNISTQTVQEDSYSGAVINLSNYFGDYNNETLLYSFNSSNSNVVVSESSALMNINTSNNFNGLVSVIVTVSDGVYFVNNTFSINVTPVNDAPVVSNPINDQTLLEDQSNSSVANLSIVFTDVDGDSLLFSASSNESDVLVSIVNNILRIDATNNFNGNASITVSASDGLLNVTDSFKALITPVNDAPVITTSPKTVASTNLTYQYDVDAFDVDGDTLVYTLTDFPFGMVINASSGLISWDVNETVANYTVTVNVSDGLLSDTQNYTLRVYDASAITNLFLSTDLINEDVDNFTIIANYSLEMNESVLPNLSFVPSLSPSLNCSSGTWLTNTSLKYYCVVEDHNFTSNNINLSIEGGKDYLLGRSQAPFNEVDAFTIDTQEPSVFAINVVSDNSNHSIAKIGNEIVLSFNASEAINMTNSQVLIDGFAPDSFFETGLSYTATRIMNSSDNEGSVSILISVKDLAGNDGVVITNTSDGSNIIFDKTAPQVISSDVDPIDNVTYSFNRTNNFSVVVSDNVGLKNVSLEFDGNNHTAIRSSPNNYYFSISNLRADTYTYRWNLEDLAGNTYSTAMNNYTIRLADPNLLLFLNGNSSLTTIDVDTNLTISSNVTTSQGIINLSIDGHEEIVGSGNVVVVKNYHSKGTHQIRVFYNSSENYSSSIVLLNFSVVDNVVPSINLTSPSNYSWTNDNPVVFTYSASDLNGYLSSCKLYVDGVFKLQNASSINETGLNNFSKLLNGGSHTWKIWCSDDSNNSIFSEERVLRLDTQEPVTNLVGVYDGGIYNTNKTIVLSARDNGDSGLNSTYYKINNGSWTVYNGSFVLSAEGNYSVSYYSVDLANNSEEPLLVSFEIDKTAPIINIENPSIGENISGSFFVNGTTSDAFYTKVYLDGSLIELINGTIDSFTSRTIDSNAYSGSSRVYADGTHNITVSVYDDAGNMNSSSLSVVFDNTKPLSSIINPASALITNSLISLNGTVIDATSGIEKLELYNGSSWNIISISNNTWSALINFSAEGDYLLMTRATDNAGNVELVSSSLRITYDSTSPTISSIETSANPVTNATSIKVTAKVSDLNGLSSVKASLNGTTTVLSETSANNYEGQLISPVSEGSYQLIVIAIDNAGNNVSSNYSLEVNTTRPSIDINPVNASYITNSTLITITIPDKDSAWYNTSENSTPQNITGSSISFTTTANNTFSLFVWANNTLGAETNVSRVYMVDNTDPVLELETIPTITNNSLLEISGNASDTNFESLRINGVLESVIGNAFSKNITLTEGNNTITIVASDKAGNTNTFQQVVLLDTISPETTAVLIGTQGTNGWYRSAVNITYMVNDGTASSGTTTQYWNGSSWINSTSYLLNSTSSFTFRTIDLAGNVENNKSTGIIKIDKQSPVINSYVSSSEVVAVNETIVFTANLTDINSGLATVQTITIEGTNMNATSYEMTSLGSGIYSLNYLASGLGTFTARLTGTDVAGNSNTSAINFSVAVKEDDLGYTFVNDSTNRRNFTDSVDTELDINVNQSVTGNLSISQFAVLPAIVNESLNHAPTFLHFELSSNVNQTLEWILIKIYYNESDLRGINESELVMHWYNESSDHWVELSTSLDFVNALGVDTANNYVWANVTHFSTYSFTGDEINCSDVLNSNNKITADCYDNTHTFRADDSGYICNGTFRTSSCPTTNSSSASEETATAPATAPANNNSTTNETSENETVVNDDEVTITETSHNTTGNDAQTNTDQELNENITTNTTNKEDSKKSDHSNLWLYILLVILLAIIGAIIYVEVFLERKKK